MAAGRNSSTQFGTDKKSVILNETAAALSGFKEACSAIGEKLQRTWNTFSVIDVTNNFYQLVLQKNIEPMLLVLSPNFSTFYSVKVRQANMQQTIASPGQIWNMHFSDCAIDLSAVAGAAALSIAIITICIQVLKAVAKESGEQFEK